MVYDNSIDNMDVCMYINYNTIFLTGLIEISNRVEIFIRVTNQISGMKTKAPVDIPIFPLYWDHLPLPVTGCFKNVYLQQERGPFWINLKSWKSVEDGESTFCYSGRYKMFCNTIRTPAKLW